jgi:LPXTG-motif cell wall-anchored protein
VQYIDENCAETGNHILSEQKYLHKAASCTETGEYYYDCLICGKVAKTEVIPALGHKYNSAVTTEPTCTEQGIRTYTCTACSDSYTEPVAALGHKWKVSEELWAGDYSSVTVTFVCENDPTHTKKETAASSESISGSVVTYTAAITLDGQEFPFSKSVDIAGQGYVFTHTTQVWVKGSTEGATFRVTRLGDDRWTYRLFTGIQVDGAPVSAYSKAPGSIILTLHPAYLETLSVGYHTLAVYLTDGEATADFLILPAGGSYYNNSTSERYTYVPPSNVPRTGDESNLMLWGMLAAVSLAGAVLIIRRRKA